MALAVTAAHPGRLAQADDARRPAPPRNDTWNSECGACHVAYPPRLLPAAAWRGIMERLDRHFGADASLDAKTAAEITAFLAANAGSDRVGPAATAPARITETPWFRRKHRKLPDSAWIRPAVKSRANCPACHPAAERGDYDDAVRVPR